MTKEIDVCVQAPTALPMRLRLNAMLASILVHFLLHFYLSDNIVDNDGATVILKVFTMGSLIGL